MRGPPQKDDSLLNLWMFEVDDGVCLPSLSVADVPGYVGFAALDAHSVALCVLYVILGLMNSVAAVGTGDSLGVCH